MVGIRVNDTGPGDKRRAYAAFWGEMALPVGRAVIASFAEANMATPTFAEQKHRITIAKKLVDECRNDLKWSKQRIIAELPRLLRAKLLGTKDPRDERQRSTTKDGITTDLYSVDPVAAALEKQLQPSAITVAKFEKELPEVDMGAGEDDGADEGAIETADPDEIDPTPPADASPSV